MHLKWPFSIQPDILALFSLKYFNFDVSFL